MNTPSRNVKAWEQLGLLPLEHLTLEAKYHVDTKTGTITMTFHCYDLVTDQTLELFSAGSCTIDELPEALVKNMITVRALVQDYIGPFDTHPQTL